MTGTDSFAISTLHEDRYINKKLAQMDIFSNISKSS